MCLCGQFSAVSRVRVHADVDQWLSSGCFHVRLTDWEVKTEQEKGWGLHSGVLHWQRVLTPDPKGDMGTDRRFMAFIRHDKCVWLVVLELLPYGRMQESRSPHWLYIFSCFCLLASVVWIICDSSLQNTALVPPPASLLTNRHASPSRSPTNHRSPTGKLLISVSCLCFYILCHWAERQDT